MFKFHRRRMFRVALATASALAAGSGLAGVPAMSASAATVPSPPFTQCPAIGASPSCEILLVVNADGSISVKGDPSVGPYDGTEDTLVGIINNSGATVNAVTVSGPASGLAGFDGDGICSGSYGNWNGSASCPYGPTGYEGPGTALVTDPSSPDNAEVDFAGGLTQGGTAYFSLEGALTAAELTARKGGLSFTVTGSDSSNVGKADKMAEGSPEQAAKCKRKKFLRDKKIVNAALSAFQATGLDTSAEDLSRFLNGSGAELDYSGTSNTADEIKATSQFTQENKDIISYIKQQLASGATQIKLPTGKHDVHTLAFTSKFSESDLYFSFRRTHTITVSGTGTLSGSNYVGSLVYVIGEAYGFSQGNKLLGVGSAARYLQTTCGAPFYKGGAHWFEETATVSVPFTIPAPPTPGN